MSHNGFDAFWKVYPRKVGKAAALRAWLRSSSRVYLLDFACYRGPDEIQTPLNLFLAQSRASGAFSDEALEFQTRISQRNGVSDHAYLPPALVSPAADRAARYPGSTLTSRTMEEARVEARMVLFRAVDDVLTKLALSPTDVDVLIVNCSLFNPTPSLSAMVVNHFKMRSDIVSFNLAGMGCSAGVLAVQLAQKVLATMPGARALVVSTENVTQNWWGGGGGAGSGARASHRDRGWRGGWGACCAPQAPPPLPPPLATTAGTGSASQSRDQTSPAACASAMTAFSDAASAPRPAAGVPANARST